MATGTTKRRKTILVVDDEEPVRRRVAAVLDEGRGYNVLMAASGSLGLEQSRKFEGEIDLVLTDFKMPGMSGVDLATAMTIDRPKLKVVLMSGFPDGM